MTVVRHQPSPPSAPDPVRPARFAPWGALLAVLVALLAICPGQASAAPVPINDVYTYGTFEVSPTKAGIPGQIFSPNDACLADRKVKLIVEGTTFTMTWDVARTSKEGAFALVGELIPGVGSTTIRVPRRTIVKRRGGKLVCAGKQLTFSPAVRVFDAAAAGLERGSGQLNARAKSNGKLLVLGVNGQNNDGAVFGAVKSRRAQCVRGRTVTVFSRTRSGRRVKLDIGKSGKGGGWAGHLTEDQFMKASKYVAVMKRKKYRQRGKKRVCTGERATFDPFLPIRRADRKGW